jgi:hypothetical protein
MTISTTFPNASTANLFWSRFKSANLSVVTLAGLNVSCATSASTEWMGRCVLAATCTLKWNVCVAYAAGPARGAEETGLLTCVPAPALPAARLHHWPARHGLAVVPAGQITALTWLTVCIFECNKK